MSMAKPAHTEPTWEAIIVACLSLLGRGSTTSFRDNLPPASRLQIQPRSKAKPAHPEPNGVATIAACHNQRGRRSTTAFVQNLPLA
mmetsp:Transcript_54327/g.129829  ORF Transcript_54327/g.129829 Transcript_54327/m.129829 type:complete len:86 (-) Transcript_54327:171-428(-)